MQPRTEVAAPMVPIDQLTNIEARYDELDAQFGDPAVTSDPDRLRAIGREQASLAPIVAGSFAAQTMLPSLYGTMPMAP